MAPALPPSADDGLVLQALHLRGPRNGPRTPPVGGRSFPPVGGRSFPPVGGRSFPPVGGRSFPPVGGRSFSPVGGRSFAPSAGNAFVTRFRRYFGLFAGNPGGAHVTSSDMAAKAGVSVSVAELST